MILGIADVPNPADGGGAESSVDGGASDTNLADVVAAQNDVDPGVCSADASACNDTTVVPIGWVPTIFSTTVLSCPNGFTGNKLLGDPQIQPNACSCTLGTFAKPVCDTVQHSNGMQCGSLNGQPDLTFSGGCGTSTGSLVNAEQLTAVPASGGSCTANASADSSKLTTPTIVDCKADACPQNVCAGIAPSGYLPCIKFTGDVACPATGIFKTKHTVGTSMVLNCGPACSCTASGTCTNGSVTFYAQPGCSGTGVKLFADGLCITNSNNNGFGYQSVGYATVMTPTYTPAVTGSPTVIASGQETVCCKQ